MFRVVLRSYPFTQAIFTAAISAQFEDDIARVSIIYRGFLTLVSQLVHVLNWELVASWVIYIRFICSIRVVCGLLFAGG